MVAAGSPCAVRKEDLELLQLLTVEVLRDGGRSAATCLGQECGPRIPQLLRRSPHGPKLCTFLQHHSDVFVLEEHGSRHVVQLRDGWQHHFAAAPVEAGGDGGAAVASAADLLHRRTLWTLQRRVARFRRRAAAAAVDSEEVAIELTPAPVHWLLGKVQHEVHGLLRLCPAHRPVGHEPFSSTWACLALQFFCGFLEERPDVFRVVHMSEHGYHGPPGPYALLVADAAPIAHTGHSRDELSCAASKQLFLPEELEWMCDRIMVLLRSAGLCHRGSTGMNLGRACEDAKMQELLQGRCLLEVLMSGALAHQVVCYQDTGRDGAWYIRVRPNLGDSEAEVGEVRCQACAPPTVMQADEVGNYSFTAHGAARKMASVLALCFERCTGQESASTGSMCIDMTAGVGGNTVALARTFHAVQAYEIDPVRCEHLRANLVAQRVAHKVQCCCSDSLVMLAAPASDGDVHVSLQEFGNIIQDNDTDSLAKNVDCQSVPLPAVMLDPPWGGVHYKRLRHDATSGTRGASLSMGGLPLAELVSRLAGRASVVGLKLPKEFGVADFLEQVRLATTIVGYTNRIVCRQRFVCLELTSPPGHKQRAVEYRSDQTGRQKGFADHLLHA